MDALGASHSSRSQANPCSEEVGRRHLRASRVETAPPTPGRWPAHVGLATMRGPGARVSVGAGPRGAGYPLSKLRVPLDESPYAFAPNLARALIVVPAAYPSRLRPVGVVDTLTSSLGISPYVAS